MPHETITITTPEDLLAFYADLPDGTTADILASDLETGNFETARLELSDGRVIDLVYTGIVFERLPVCSGDE